MDNTKTNKREWVKTVLIIFLVIMLILTFFSNTIMNRSLPEVATQTVYSGAINAKIRGTGTISANETYDVTLSQTRKIKSIMVRTGDEVQVGDLLMTLEPMDSEELQQAKDTLATMELNYQKSLIAASNGSASENREVQKLQDAYNEALELYQLYSNEDPDTLLIELEKAELEQQQLEQLKTDITNDLTSAQQSEEYLEAKEELPQLKEALNAAISSYEELDAKLKSIDALENEIQQDKVEVGDYQKLESLYNDFVGLVDRWFVDAAIYSTDVDALINLILSDEILGDPDVFDHDVEIYARQLQNAYLTVSPIKAKETEKMLLDSQREDLEKKWKEAGMKKTEAEKKCGEIEHIINSYETFIDGIECNLEYVSEQLNQLNAYIATMNKASMAAESLKSAEQALEDKLFDLSLSDSSSLDMQKEKEAIEKQKELIETLSAEADGQEIYSTVSGVISRINTSAGNTVGAESPVMSITIADRGYMMQIPVTAEQARKVSIGDTAEVTNYWYGNINATLENIINDPQNMTGGKILMFRLTGDDLQAGTNLTLSIGQRSANYDTIVPNSAIRTDSNGKFVLVIVAKSSPLGNRYIATRADVQVLASDDTTSAVSGLAYGDFVITTSTVPIEAGNQVRLVDNG